MRNLQRMFVALLLLGNITLVSAQQMQIPPIPQDKDVRVGKLENGLTYYIRHNQLPEKQAEFYIAQKVGSIMENDKQRGLAHFLEHMCFNGTKNFPGKTLITYLESIGVKFGQNLNAYTSIDETVYNISNVPVTRDGIIDSCLLILHDWSNNLALENKEIDEERGVIHEEWRTRMNPMLRMYEKALPEMYPNCKYGYRLPIGLMEVVDNFPYQVLKDYYHKWYRPDLQGIIVVGDIDVDKIEQKIKDTFSHIVLPKDAAKREYVQVEDLNKPIVTIATDKEQTRNTIFVNYKYDNTPDSLKNRMDYLATNFMKSMITNMINTRIGELLQAPNPPFIYANVSDDDYFIAKTKAAVFGNIGSKDNEILSSLKAFFTEIERVRRFGFTQSEYDRARANYLTQLESEYNERSKTKNGSYVDEYVQNFLNNEPIPGIENEYNIMSNIVPNIPVEAVNQLANAIVSDKNIVVSLFCPEKDGIKIPSKDEIFALIDNNKNLEVTAYVDKVSNEPLISELPKPGKIVKTTNGAYGTTILTLSNGARVIIKPTDFKKDQILMSAYSPGGSSLFPNDEVINIDMLNSVARVGGLGKFSNTDLKKTLAGKKVSIDTSIDDNTENLSGNCSPKDMESLMQLIYLSFTSPRKDENAFKSYMERVKASLKNQEAMPQVALSDTIQKALFMNHPRAIRFKSDMVDKVDYEKILDMYKDRYKDASDFTFIFVGNIDTEKAKPLIEQYIATLPSINRKETFKDNKQYYRKGEYTNVFNKKLETAKSTIVLVYNGKCKYDLKNRIMMSMFDQLMDITFTDEVREKESGTYGVDCGGFLTKYPKEDAILQVSFDTKPELRERLTILVKDLIDKFAKDGPTETNLNKIKEYMLKSFKDKEKENGYWLGLIDDYYWKNIDSYKDYEATVKSITTKDLSKFASSLLKQKNIVEVCMTDDSVKQ